MQDGDAAAESARAARRTRSTDRTEAFSDGVMAVAITLLILDIGVPRADSPHYVQELVDAWPKYLAYLVSFATIGIIWINHHAVFTLIARVDRVLLLVNLGLLLTVTSIPFTTRLVGEALAAHENTTPATVVYMMSLEAMGLMFGGLFAYALRHPGLRAEHVAAESARGAILRFSVGGFVYVVATAIALVHAEVSLLIALAMSAYYAALQLDAP